jgi:transcriptional regulator with XRE-family HTH domain
MEPMKRKRREKPSDQLRRIIAESGLSRYEIARRTGVDESALSRFMSGERGLTTDSIDRLAPALGLELVARKPKGRQTKGRK